MKVILIIGLPASGKTTYGKSLIKNKNDYFFDENLSKINSIPKDANLVIFTHPLFCIQEKLKSFKDIVKKHTNDIEEIYFENNYKQCLKNAKLRNKDVELTILRLTKIYNPNNVNYLQVYKA